MDLCILKWSIRHRPERRVFRHSLLMLKFKNTCLGWRHYSILQPQWYPAVNWYHLHVMFSSSHFPGIVKRAHLEMKQLGKWNTGPQRPHTQGPQSKQSWIICSNSKNDQLPKKLQHRGEKYILQAFWCIQNSSTPNSCGTSKPCSAMSNSELGISLTPWHLPKHNRKMFEIPSSNEIKGT